MQLLSSAHRLLAWPVVLVLACGGRSGDMDGSGDGSAMGTGAVDSSDDGAAGTAGGGDTGGTGGASGSGSSTVPTYPQRLVEVTELTNSPAPASCIEGLPSFLPTCGQGDPNLQGIECDGDGVLDYVVHNCDVSTAERPAFFGGSFDCAPEDPGLRHWVLRDADGDGIGGGVPLCAGPEMPFGYVPAPLDAPNDCDDQDPDVHPGALDVWGDGVDHDCFNADLPVCAGLTADMHVSRAPSVLGTCSPGPDLYLSSIAVCGTRCSNGGTLFGFVGNSGTLEASGPFEVRYRDSTGSEGSIELDIGELAPGAASALFEVPYGLVTEVEVWIESEDCSLGNDRYVYSNPNGDQICLY